MPNRPPQGTSAPRDTIVRLDQATQPRALMEHSQTQQRTQSWLTVCPVPQVSDCGPFHPYNTPVMKRK